MKSNNLEQKKEKSVTFFCPKCSRDIETPYQRCPQCSGKAVFSWFIDRILYWGKPLDSISLSEDTIFFFFRKIRTVAVIFFGLLGVLGFGWLLLEQLALGYQEWRFWNIDDYRVSFFYFSLLLWMYWYYRYVRDHEKRRRIQRHRYQELEPYPAPSSFEEGMRLNSKLFFDISRTFTDTSLRTIERACKLAENYQHVQALPIHLFLALLEEKHIRVIFLRLGIDQEILKTKLVAILKEIPNTKNSPVQPSISFFKALLDAYQETYRLRHLEVGPEEMLLSLVKQKEEVFNLLYDLSINEHQVENTIQWIFVQEQMAQNWKKYRKRAKLKPKTAMDRAMTAVATPYLDRFSQDLTLLAKAGYLTPCVGRENEIEEIFRILQGGRRSVILVGNPGVGKTSVIEGIAQLMTSEDVPELLQDKRLVSLSLSQLISGADASEAQGRLSFILEEILRARNIVLFISDIQDMVGVTIGEKESLDLSEILAKALASGAILALSTTTPRDYARYIENAALGNAFEKVALEEPEQNSAIQILEAKAGNIEYRHQIFFSYAALEAAVLLSSRYLHERYLPEKAIQLIEETAVSVRKTKGSKSIATQEDVVGIISEKTGIPLSKITKNEAERLLQLEEKIHERMIDQEEAVKAVSSALRRARAQLRDIKRPIATFLFLGPTGVGKTELAKTVAEVYFSAETEMIRLDMSEYQEKSSIGRLLGSVGSSDSEISLGFLSEAVRKKPFSLLLLDEIEKAHPDILNVFLQVMDDGRLTDISGRVIDFTNVILIATSNAGTPFIQEELKKGTALATIQKNLVENELQPYFRPEFLNRFDGIVVFKTLSFFDVKEITKLMLKKVSSRLENEGIIFEYSEKAVEELAQMGYDPQFGARPLRRVIQEQVDNVLASSILKGELERRDVVRMEGVGKIEITKSESK